MRHYYVGLMSGTSRDGIDAAMLAVDGDTLSYIGGQTTPYPNALRQQLAQLVQPSGDELDQAGRVDQLLGAHFAEATEQLLLSHKIPAERITAIGSHGHTLRHRPHPPYPFTWQMADPNQIAWRTGITTIADFRRMDMAAGGQGAPLVPAFHRAWFANRAENRVILNIGGIANITLLPASAPQQVTGFDTGPGNTLMDAWIRECEGKSHDRQGPRWTRNCWVDCCRIPIFNGNRQKVPGRSISI